MMEVQQNPPIELRPFEDAAIGVLRELQLAMADLVAQLPGRVLKAADVQHKLNVNSKLGWQVFRVISAESPLAAAGFVPNAKSMARLAHAAASKELPPPVIEGVTRAMHRFESVVEHHAENREMFEVMVAGLGQIDQIDQTLRREAFQAMASVWGVRVKTLLSCYISSPGAEPHLEDSVSLRGGSEITRLRKTVEFRLALARHQGKQLQVNSPQPVDPDVDLSGPGPSLLKPFCTQPYPQLINRRINEDYTETLLAPGEVGKLSASTLYLADITRDSEWYYAEDGSNELISSVRVAKPAEVLVQDILVHRDLAATYEPSVVVYGNLDQPSEADHRRYRPQHRLMIPATMQRLGRGPDAIATPDVPRYPEMIEYICSKVGWNANEYEVFRSRIEFPLLHSVTAASVRLQS